MLAIQQKSYQDPIDKDFQRRYACVVLELERLNKVWLSLELSHEKINIMCSGEEYSVGVVEKSGVRVQWGEVQWVKRLCDIYF